MELSARSIVTEEEIRSYLRIDEKDNPDLHEPIVILINSVSDAIETATRKKFMTYADEWIFDGTGKNTIYTRYRPVIGTPTIYLYDGDSWETAATYNMTPIVVAATGKIYFEERYATLPDGVMNIKVSYSAGYASRSTIPHGVRLAAMKLVAMYLNETRNERQGLKSESIEGATISFDYNSWPDDIKRLLGLRERSPYRVK